MKKMIFKINILLKSSLLLFVILLSSCSQNFLKNKHILRVACTINEIKLSKFPETNSYNIYVSLKLTNNTKDSLYIPPYDLINHKYKPFIKSYFIGEIDNDIISFYRLNNQSLIPPNDSVNIILFKMDYSPILTNDSLFIEEIKSINFCYIYEDLNINTNYKYIEKIEFQNIINNNIIILNDNFDLESAFRK